MQISLQTAQAQLPDLIRLASEGEEVLIDSGAAIVRLVPFARSPEARTNVRIAVWAGEFWMAEDLDAPLDDFAEYMQ